MSPFDFLDPKQRAFREEVRAFLSAWPPINGFFDMATHEELDQLDELYRAMGERGWLSLSWPEEHGGAGLSPIYEYIVWNELAYLRLGRPPVASGIVAKGIMRYGTERQRAEFLPAIRAGKITFGLGYSEPEAGSDLASLRTRATADGDHYVVNGEKRWTGYGHHADYLWLLCRTGAQESRGRGLSLLIVDRRSPGIEIRPLPTMAGEQLNEIRFVDVRVPRENLVGEENGAWAIIGELLAVERHNQFPTNRLRRDFDDIVAFAEAVGLTTDPLVRSRLAELDVQVCEAEALGWLLLDTAEKGRSGVVEAAASKLLLSQACQDVARAALDFGGPESIVVGTMPEFLWRQSISETIAGGTSEIMRGIIARQHLGLAGT